MNCTCPAEVNGLEVEARKRALAPRLLNSQPPTLLDGELFLEPHMSNQLNLSPYLRDPNRLGDVIAAIQAMAVYKFYKLSFSEWADRIAADRGQADKWKAIFLGLVGGIRG